MVLSMLPMQAFGNAAVVPVGSVPGWVAPIHLDLDPTGAESARARTVTIPAQNFTGLPLHDYVQYFLRFQLGGGSDNVAHHSGSPGNRVVFRNDQNVNSHTVFQVGGGALANPERILQFNAVGVSPTALEFFFGNPGSPLRFEMSGARNIWVPLDDLVDPFLAAGDISFPQSSGLITVNLPIHARDRAATLSVDIVAILGLGGTMSIARTIIFDAPLFAATSGPGTGFPGTFPGWVTP